MRCLQPTPLRILRQTFLQRMTAVWQHRKQPLLAEPGPMTNLRRRPIAARHRHQDGWPVYLQSRHRPASARSDESRKLTFEVPCRRWGSRGGRRTAAYRLELALPTRCCPSPHSTVCRRRSVSSRSISSFVLRVSGAYRSSRHEVAGDVNW